MATRNAPFDSSMVCHLCLTSNNREPSIDADILAARLDAITAHIRATYDHVRWNNVLSHHVHHDILARLPRPRPHEYLVQLLVSFAVLIGSTMTILGLPFPPVVFELAMVDYRAYFASTRAERYGNSIALWDSLRLRERAAMMKRHNGYMTMMLKNEAMMRRHCEKEGFSVPKNRSFAPDEVYKANLGC